MRFNFPSAALRGHVRPLVSSMEVLIKNISHVRADKAQLGWQSAARSPLIMRVRDENTLFAHIQTDIEKYFVRFRVVLAEKTCDDD